MSIADIPIDPWVLTQELVLDTIQLSYQLKGTIPETSITEFSMTHIDETGTMDIPLRPMLEEGDIDVYFGK